MSRENRNIQSIATGRIYTVRREISTKEAKFVSKKMAELVELDKEAIILSNELSEIKQQEETRESLIRQIDLLLAQTDNQDKSLKTVAQLNEMMSSTLRNCFDLTTSEIAQIEPDERRSLFLKLAEVCR